MGKILEFNNILESQSCIDILIAGIDPGKDGGYVALDSQGRIIQKMPLAIAINGLCRSTMRRPYHIFVERAQVMNKSRDTNKEIKPSAVAMFSYGVGFGEILGVLRALNIAHTQVSPVRWTSVMHMGTLSTKAPKKRSFDAAKRLFPAEDWMIPGRTLPHDGLAEAALIAEFGRRTLGLHQTRRPA